MNTQFEVFDKIKWHTENGISFKNAKRHLKVIFDFLYANNLLSDEGIEIYEEDGITEDFSLNTDLLTEKGIVILNKTYNDYLKAIPVIGGKKALIQIKKELKYE